MVIKLIKNNPPDELANSTATHEENTHANSFVTLLTNAEILSSNTTSTLEKLAAKAAFVEIVSPMIAIGLHKHLLWKNPELQRLMEEIAK